MERKTPPQTMQEKKRNEIMYILTSSFLASIESEDDKDMKLSLFFFFAFSPSSLRVRVLLVLG